MISSLRASSRALARGFEGGRRLGPEQLCGQAAAAGEASAAADDDEHLPARVTSDAFSVAAARRR